MDSIPGLQAFRKPTSSTQPPTPAATVSVNFGVSDRRGAFEEVEVATLVGLRHVTRVEMAVAAGVGHFARGPGGAAGGELLVAHAQRQATGGHVELDDVAVADEREWTAGKGLRRD